MVFIFLVTILALFDVAPPEGEFEYEFSNTLVRWGLQRWVWMCRVLMRVSCYSYPKPFRCKITPRSDAKESLIRALSE